MWDRMRPYIQPYLKSTPRVSPTVSRSYINRMESFETIHKSYIQHPINTRILNDNGTIHTIAHTVSNGRHTTNSVQVRIIHGRHSIERVCTGLTRPGTVLHSLYVSRNCTTKTTTTCCHPDNCSIWPEYLLYHTRMHPKKQVFPRTEGI
jgi:hypothetical protein